MKKFNSIVRLPVKYICDNSYYISKLRYQYSLKKKLNEDKYPPILLYQMGKVGSTSIANSLRSLDLNRSVYHSHLLTWDRIKETESDRKKYFMTNRYSHLKRPWANAFIRKQIEKGYAGKKWKIISLVRDPIARNLSTFFENAEVSYSKEKDKYLVGSEYYGFEPVEIDLDNLQELISVYFEKFKHDSPLTFFDNEIKTVLGFDVYKTQFEKKKGYAIYYGDDFDVMIVRLENLSDVATAAFNEFLEIRNFELVNSNIGSQKEYAMIYKKMKSVIRLPEEYIDKFYSSKFVMHFYEPAEIDKFRNRWSSKSL